MNTTVSTIGCIGCGNMGGAIIHGLAANASCSLIGYDTQETVLQDLTAKKIHVAQNIQELASTADIIILAVKPWLVEKILPEIRSSLNSSKVVVSVAAGVSMASLQNGVANICPVIRCMPNTPALVGAGVYAFCFEDEKLSPNIKDYIFTLFQSIGTCLELPEKSFAAFSALIGAGPAYVFHLMNAVVQAGVTLGFARAESKRLVEALFEGSIQMAKASPHNLTELRDQVCSPAGLTIEGVNYLERHAIGGHIVDAILAADKKAHDMENT